MWESLKRLLPAHNIFLQKENTLFSASNKLHLEDHNYRKDWDTHFLDTVLGYVISSLVSVSS